MRVRACAEPCCPSAWDHLHPVTLLSLGTQVGTLRPLEVSGTGTRQVCRGGDQVGGLCNRPASQAGSPDGTGWWVPAWLLGQQQRSHLPHRESWAGQGLQGGQGCLCPPARLGLRLSLPCGHLCDGLSTEKQQSNPSRALLGCQLPFL